VTDQHVEWLLTASPEELYRWHSARTKAEVVQSLAALIVAWSEERRARNESKSDG
jgi:hypothetical protein